MASEYEIEMSEPALSRCDCCGGLSVRLTRFVCRNGDAFAVYYATYSNNHPSNELAMLVSLGAWGEGSDPSQRTAFYCRVRATDDSYEVMLGDAAESPWSDVDIVGERLSREDARRHPWKSTAFEVLDEAFENDRSLRGFLHRVHCGDAAVPLELGFDAPDDIFALGDDEKGRAALQRNFASLDGERFFVRCLLPVPVEGYGTWCVGLWIEVAKADYEEIRSVWDEPQRYSVQRFSGRVANAMEPEYALPVMRGTEVQVHVPDRQSRPMIAAPASGELADLISNVWPRSDFEAYAVVRGIL